MKPTVATYAVLFLAFVVLNAGCRKSNPNPEQSAKNEVESPASAPAPNPAGPTTRATIGVAGGTLKSSDGRIEISLPPGALPGETQVEIQPVTAQDLESVGPVYQLSPEGTRFAQPVMLAWHLQDSDLAGRPISALTIASQDENGGWKRQPGVQRDPSTKVIQISTSHFSRWSAAWLSSLPDLTVTPAQAAVHVTKSVALQAVVTYDDLNASLAATPDASGLNGESDPDLLYTPTPKSGDHDGDLLTPPTPTCVWKVNGVVGGSDASGRIQGAGNHATYLAPAKIPQRNPVAISCETQGRAKIIAISNLTVTDQQGWDVSLRYFYNDEHSDTGRTVAGTTGTNWAKETRLLDSAFTMSPDDRFGGGAAGGIGTGTLRLEQRSGTKVGCEVGDATTLSGPAKVEAQGFVGSGAGTLSVSLRAENMEANSEHSGNCPNNNTPPKQHWNTGSFGTSCNFVGIDYEKGGTYSADIPSDQGHGQCKLTIKPQ